MRLMAMGGVWSSNWDFKVCGALINEVIIYINTQFFLQIFSSAQQSTKQPALQKQKFSTLFHPSTNHLLFNSFRRSNEPSRCNSHKSSSSSPWSLLPEPYQLAQTVTDLMDPPGEKHLLLIMRMTVAARPVAVKPIAARRMMARSLGHQRCRVSPVACQ